MRRIGRYILNGLTVLSLVLCVVPVAVWVMVGKGAEYVAYSWVSQEGIGRAFVLRVYGGDVDVFMLDGQSVTWRDGWERRSFSPSEARRIGINSPNFKWFGFAWSHRARDHWWEADVRDLTVPCWFIVLAAATIPLLRALRRLRCHPTEGYCAICNYDLRATPDRCPECGTIPTKVKA